MLPTAYLEMFHWNILLNWHLRGCKLFKFHMKLSQVQMTVFSGIFLVNRKGNNLGMAS